MNEYQKRRFTDRVISCLFNTLTGKKIAVLGFAFKKNTGDTRESPAIALVNYFLAERANVSIYDPKVEDSQIWMDLSEPGVVDDLTELKKQVSIATSAYSACDDADAIVICTEWDEFRDTYLDYERIYENMKRPAFVFDGRLILDRNRLEGMGFRVETIGRAGGFKTPKDWE